MSLHQNLTQLPVWWLFNDWHGHCLVCSCKDLVLWNSAAVEKLLHPELVPKWSQSGPKMQNRPKMVPKTVPKASKIIPKRSQNGSKMVSKLSQNDSKMVPTFWSQNGPKTKWSQNGPKWSRNDSKIRAAEYFQQKDFRAYPP